MRRAGMSEDQEDQEVSKEMAKLKLIIQLFTSQNKTSLAFAHGVELMSFEELRVSVACRKLSRVSLMCFELGRRSTRVDLISAMMDALTETDEKTQQTKRPVYA
jgi:hypothetical protein